MLLEDKVAVIYGAGGAVGRAVTLAFAREGATLFLTGRHAASVEGLAREINATGESAEAEVLDALDGEGIDKHLDAVIAKAGRVDISNVREIVFSDIAPCCAPDGREARRGHHDRHIDAL